MNESVLLSIIIPTKNRYETLIPVLNSLVKYIMHESYEIVVQDNSDSNLYFLEHFKLSDKTKYFYSSERLSIIENTELSIRNSIGKFLIFIGDDDFVHPNIVEIVELMVKRGIDNLSYTPAYYWWNSVEFTYENYYYRKNAFWLNKKLNLAIELRNSSAGVDKLLSSGGIVLNGLPKFYHGIVSRQVLEMIYEKCGTYIPGISPDLSFALSIALLEKKFYFMDFPISVFGASKNSGGGLTARKMHYSKLEEATWLPLNINERWNPSVPKIWSEKTTYVQTVYDVLRAFGLPDKINYGAFYGAMLAFEPFLYKYLKPFLIKYIAKSYLHFIDIIVHFIFRKLGMFKRRIHRIFKTEYEVHLCNTVDSCMEILISKTK